MLNFFITLLICSITMSALALLYMAVTPLLAKRYSTKWRYYTWLIIVIGLIIPFRPHFDTAIIMVNVPVETSQNVQAQVWDETPNTIPNENTSASVDLLSISWEQIAAGIWLAGMISVFFYHAIRHYRFVKMVGRWSNKITDARLNNMILSLSNQMGISTTKVLESSCILTPMMIGFFTPVILLPKTDFSDNELTFILKHELIHFKRKDLWYKCAVLTVTAMHWFNPAVYLMAKEIGAQCELSCDEEVLRSEDADTRQQYSETIIGVIRDRYRMKTALSTNFYGGKKGMKKRIYSIMDMTKKKAGIIIFCATLVLTMGTGMAFTANASTQSEANADFHWPFGGVVDQIRKNQTEKIFDVYNPYGLFYDKGADRLYYNEELVRYFEDIENNNSYKKWPSKDGTIDVYAVRNDSGDLVGVQPFSQQAFDERTPSLEFATCALQITKSITITNTNSKSDSSDDYNLDHSYYTKEMEQRKKEVLEQTYVVYQQFGLTYDKESDRLNYNGNLVRYFEDRALYRFFGPYQEGIIDIYAIRDDAGNLIGLETYQR